MSRLNILNKEGLLSDEDRKQPLKHGCNHFNFESCIDLSIGVKVIPYGSSDVQSIQNYSQDLAAFMCWWNHFVMRDLNGFSGFSHIKFELAGFKLV